MKNIQALGYVRTRATDMDSWKRFADAIGFAYGSGDEDGALYLRMDERAGRIVVLPDEVDAVSAVGWEAPHGAALDAVREAVDASGIETTPLSQDELDIRRVEAAFRFIAPGSTPIEVFHGAALDHSPLSTPYGNRFVTGDLGLGHAVVPVTDLDAAFSFYTEVLGFYTRGAFRLPPTPEYRGQRLRFMGVNARHHSMAIIPATEIEPPALVHVMVECETLDEVGRALDRVTAAGFHVSVTLGRHTNDKMVSFYVRTPSGWDLEVGCEGKLVDQATYSADEITADSYWGHEYRPYEK
ncbi:VOC family protein [Gordonia sp. NPDC127522]|uniref:VOC family protein n=1 Tax=Gordonia sp. NPDC127522 TaxID=3345390 RepID=UPI00362B76DC